MHAGINHHQQEARPRARWHWPLAPAVFNLDNPARYVHWHFFQMSVANVVVILLMIGVFIAAVLIPFPSRKAGS